MSLSAEVREKAQPGTPEKKNPLDAARSTEAGAKPDKHNCVICGCELRTHFAVVHDAKSPDIFSILECPQCGLGVTIPKPENLAKYYLDYHGGRHGITNAFCTNRRVGILRRLAGDPAGKRLLDVGCGEGSFLLAAKKKGWSVAGTEMNPSAARSLGLEVHPQLSSARGLPPFDCITFWHSLEHMPDLRATLQEARSLLSPQGLLIVAVPDAGGIQARVFGSNWLHLDVPRHLYHFTRNSLKHLLRSERFAPIGEWHQEFEYDLLGWSQSALNLGPAPPNVFFDLLTGRKPAIGPWRRISTWAAGCVLTGLALFLVPLGTVAKRGGTMIVAARPC